MKTYFIISLLPYLFFILNKSKKFMHMLQQNWYNDGNRYLKWLRDNFSKSFINVEILFLLFYFIVGNYAITFFILFYIVLFMYLIKVRNLCICYNKTGITMVIDI